MRTYPKVKVAAVQASPVYMNMEASVEKACNLIRKAAAEGVKLIGFPESFLPGYPYWIWVDDPISTMPYTQQFFAQVLECPGAELAKIASCAKENHIYVCIGATEREQSSVYDTQFLFGDDGTLLYKHRKLKPMHSEKMLWGEGDASTLSVANTPIGRIGSLMSCEHMQPVNSMALCAQREEIHIASFAALPDQPANYRDFSTYQILTNCYAISNACYLIFSTQVLNEETLNFFSANHPEYAEKIIRGDLEKAGGRAFVLNPDGEVISNTLAENEEGFVTAKIDLAAIGVANFFGDTTGHYCNPVVWLEVEKTHQKVVRVTGKEAAVSIPYETMIMARTQETKGYDA